VAIGQAEYPQFSLTGAQTSAIRVNASMTHASTACVYPPACPNGNMVIVHACHSCDFNDGEMHLDVLISTLLENAFSFDDRSRGRTRVEDIHRARVMRAWAMACAKVHPGTRSTRRRQAELAVHFNIRKRGMSRLVVNIRQASGRKSTIE
jgi:hypothetical protein